MNARDTATVLAALRDMAVAKPGLFPFKTTNRRN
jgi:hypothetical protein